MPKKIDPELRARAVRLVNEHLGEYQNVTAASVAVAKQLGVSRAGSASREAADSSGLGSATSGAGFSAHPSRLLSSVRRARAS